MRKNRPSGNEGKCRPGRDNSRSTILKVGSTACIVSERGRNLGQRTPGSVGIWHFSLDANSSR